MAKKIRGWGWRPRPRWRRKRRRRSRQTRRRAKPAASGLGRRSKPKVRRRRTRRRRVYKRGWRRRRYIRRARRKTKLVLTQWNPAVVKSCNFKGGLTIIICGEHRATYNYGYHMENYTPQPFPFGGGMSTETFSLKGVFDQYLTHQNRWTFSNEQLDLGRYRGCKLRFYESPVCEFIVHYNLIPPLNKNQFTSPNTHPGLLMLSKHKIIIPIFQSRPEGKRFLKIRLNPPKLFEDKWFTQQDLCIVPLVSITAPAADLRYPFCSTQTNNPSTTFQVLRKNYNTVIGTSVQDKESTQNLEKWLYGTDSKYQTFATEAHLCRIPAFNPDGTKNSQKEIWQKSWSTNTDQWSGSGNYPQDTTEMYKIPYDSNFGYPTNKAQPQYIKNRRALIFKYEIENPVSKIVWPQPSTTTPTVDHYEYHCGWFSNIFIGPNRYNLQFQTANVDTTYNPLMGKGTGTKLWFQYLSKKGTDYNEKQCYCLLGDMPLWAMCFGYTDYVETQLGPNVDHETAGLLIIICPYTQPPMYDKTKPNWGYVVYDTNFGIGKLPSGTGQVPVYWQCRWKPMLYFQEQVLNDISKTGLYAYRDEYKNVQLTLYQNFILNWGGDMYYPQVVKNPCGDSGIVPGSGRFTREVQVVNPLSMGPAYIFHYFDSRRGFFNEKALKRMPQPQEFDDSLTFKPKRPKLSTAATEILQFEEDSSSGEGKTPLQQKKKEAEILETSQIQLQLIRNIQEQLAIQHQLQFLLLQLLKTQSNLHLNPQFLSRA
uniref:Capsid protein n=1 Tax=Torque teno virus TaxID=68887 RepID=A0A6B7HCX2_9VIRU|nr:ORF1 [Torque teno virus]